MASKQQPQPEDFEKKVLRLIPCTAVEYSSRQSAYAKRAGMLPASWRRANGESMLDCVSAPRESSNFGTCSSVDDDDAQSRRTAALPAANLSLGVARLLLA